MNVLISILTTGTRNNTLVECIESALNQKVGGNVSFDVLVIENNKTLNRELKKLLLKFSENYPNFHHCLESNIGIPFARNRAISEASRRSFSHVAFLDDDAYADESWLFHLTNLALESGAEVVTGPQYPIFPSETVSLFKNAVVYRERSSKHLQELKWAATNNVLFDVNFFVKNDLYFNNNLVFGGEDKELFLRASHKGARIIWSSNAIVSEHIAISRLTVSWALRRNFRIGATGFLIESSNKSSFSAIVSCIIKAMCYLGRGAISLIPFMLIKNKSVLNPLCDFSHGIGFIYGLFTKGRVKKYT